MRIFKLPKYTANNIPLLALQWPLMRCRCLCAFLHRVRSDDDDFLRKQVFTSLAASDVKSINLVKQCHFLEHAYGTNFTDNILSDSDLPVRSLKQEIIKVDFSFTLAKAKDHQSLKYVRDIALNGGWMRVWDVSLDRVHIPCNPQALM